MRSHSCSSFMSRINATATRLKNAYSVMLQQWIPHGNLGCWKARLCKAMDSLRESGLLGNQVMYRKGFPAGIWVVGKPGYVQQRIPCGNREYWEARL